MLIENLKTEELIKLVRDSYAALKNDCFGSRDVQYYYIGTDELRRRGYAIEESAELVISKTDDVNPEEESNG